MPAALAPDLSAHSLRRGTPLCCVLATWLLLSPSLSAADIHFSPDQTADPAEAALQHLVNQADFIFSGQVLTTIPDPADPGESTIRFRIETVVRGAPATIFTANFPSEIPGTPPLQPGERLVLFLHAPNAGLRTSIVSGNCGLLQRTGGDRVDLRRLQLCFRPAPVNPPELRSRFRLVADSEARTMATIDLMRLLQHLARHPLTLIAPPDRYRNPTAASLAP